MTCVLRHSSHPRLMAFARACCLAVLLAYLIPAVRAEDPSPEGPVDNRPLSPAQIALFETPHLQNVTQPETLRYEYTREGPAGFSDKVAMHVRHVNADGSKDLAFDYLTGTHRVPFPELDHFRGNPVLMIALENDVNEMKSAIGISAIYLRNRIRESFVDAATIAAATTSLDGRTVSARRITVEPFARETRFERIPSLQAKTYSFVLSDEVPGMIAEIAIQTPDDTAMKAPAMSEHITFDGVEP
jgi:hypothetical protein